MLNIGICRLVLCLSGSEISSLKAHVGVMLLWLDVILVVSGVKVNEMFVFRT